MSVKRTFECNLCGRIAPYPELIGIKWQGGGTGNLESFRPRIKAMGAAGCEHHICTLCVDEVSDLKGCGEYVSAQRAGHANG